MDSEWERQLPSADVHPRVTADHCASASLARESCVALLLLHPRTTISHSVGVNSLRKSRSTLNGETAVMEGGDLALI